MNMSILRSNLSICRRTLCLC